MISNCPHTSQKYKQKQLYSGLHNIINRNSSATLYSKASNQSLLQRTTLEMSTLAATVAAAAVNEEPLVKTPMEAVVVNSIIYSKPSFCRISVDLGDAPVDKKLSTKMTSSNLSCPNNVKCTSMNIQNTDFFDAASCLADLAATSSLEVGNETKLYRMCTTINGSIQHQISDLCDNILAMAGLFGAPNNKHDDDSFIEFAYRDDSEDDDSEGDDENESVDYEDDYYDEVDDDNDVVDFSYECPIEPTPIYNCDRKKVRFNTKPTVHVMHTWSYAYRAARKGEWEMHARDRERFKLRVQRTALTLNPILEREHRQKIYDKRFANTYNKDDGAKEDSFDLTKSKITSNNTESKKLHQKKKRRKRRFCKMGNKHYF